MSNTAKLSTAGRGIATRNGVADVTYMHPDICSDEAPGGSPQVRLSTLHSRSVYSINPLSPACLSLHTPRFSSAMPGLDDDNGSSRERGKEQQCLLMHPCASVVPGCKHFYPYGEKGMKGGRIMSNTMLATEHFSAKKDYQGTLPFAMVDIR